MSDRAENNIKAPPAQANVVRIWYEQATVGENSKAFTPKVLPQGSGWVTSKDGSDCFIETDSHVVTPQPTADVRLTAKQKASLSIPADATAYVTLNLDATTKIRPFVQLADGKTVEAQIVKNDTKLDHAVLKFDTNNGDNACTPSTEAKTNRLKIGELLTELGFGAERKVSSHTLVLTGEKTVGEIKKTLARQNIQIDDVIQKWDENMTVLIFDGEANAGDSGGPVLNKDGVRIGRALASGAVTLEGKTKHITYAAPINSQVVNDKD